MRLLKSYFKKVMVLDFVISVIVAIICWMGGLRSIYYYANGLFIAGSIIVIIGSLSGLGSHNRLGDMNYYKAKAASSEGVMKSMSDDMQQINNSGSFAVFTAISGGTLMLLSFIIHNLA